MDYDFRTSPLYSNSSSTMYGQSMYPMAPRPTPYHHSVPPPSSSSPGLGIRVLMKPDYRMTHPPPLAPLVGDIPRSNFQFDFYFEKKVLAEAEKQSPNWNKLAAEIAPPRTSERIPPPSNHVGDPVVGKYVALGLSWEAVTVAVANYGDNPVKGDVQGFVVFDAYDVRRDYHRSCFPDERILWGVSDAVSQYMGYLLPWDKSN